MSSGSTILIVGQASQKTGLARVTRAMAGHLAGHFDVHVLGIDCFAPQPAGSWTLHHNDAAHDVYAEARLTALTDELRPAAIVLYNDIWVIARYFDPLRRAAHRPPVIGYVPLDGTIAQPWLRDTLAPLDAVVVFTEFARKAVQPLSAHVIPHGLDAGAFFPTDRLAARKTLFPERPDLWSGFWVLNANRNQPRKRLDLTLQGFARFAAGKPSDVRLYLHCGLKDIGFDLMREARILGIEERLLFTENGDGHPSSPTSSLNLIYNACEVGVNTATGEGWGLIACEHAATRAAQIVPRHSACAEIWDGAAELITPVEACTDGFLNGGIIDPAELAAVLERLYANPALRESRADAAYERIMSPAYRWECIAGQWRDVITGIANSSRQR